MTGPEPAAARFTRAPRAENSSKDVARENFLDSLDAIDAFVLHATSGGRSDLCRNSPAYASGSMAVIRAAALFEVDDFADFLTGTPDEVVRALRTMRNIASHSGYRAMNDEFLWVSLTVELPPFVAQWRRAAQATDPE
ncbi:hypothetical protein QE410_002619 [Microbacterium sp. SORGH_AS 1204]|uniref:hypothetical protein n=1 Tax=Microbacterium sp. SORGH_AS_1204 TaxID=3041785 RepID=UPI002790B5CE|nr:hypothetical protein [Microbacterium sp. SORGH_AS_1204]MDQ1137820.1 hypothetical protein [Microbacterium sp. SORGH_AS_1204]